MKPLEALRQQMTALKIDAFVAPSNDSHLGEYVPEHFKCRQWLTGFDGSAGTAVVTQTAAALFTDSRYFLQAERQLTGSGFTLHKTGLANSLTVAEYLLQALPAGAKVGVDAALFSVAKYEDLREDLQPLKLRDVKDVFSKIWDNRPALPAQTAWLLEAQYAGRSVEAKLALVREKLCPAKNSVYVVTALDQVAWLLNLRGGDIAHTPVALAYAVVHFDSNSVTLFIDPNKLNTGIKQQLLAQQVGIESYAGFERKIGAQVKGKIAILHPAFTSCHVAQLVAKSAAEVWQEQGFTTCINALKATKNDAEVAGIRQAMVNDGVAWVRFWCWLEQNIDREKITEVSAAQRLRKFREEHPLFLDESFAPIVAYGAHGATVHYSATPQSNATLGRDSFLLVDTGAQSPLGTTDITRTLHLGNPTPRQIMDYTLVLAGHVALSTAVFPEGTRGAQLDVLARRPLLNHRMNFLHGSGHGVGHCLSVHEGPQSIHTNENPAVLQPGMVTSCEPGLYRTGEYGVRIENLLLTVDGGASEFGRFFAFETLTLCPYDLRCVDAEALSAEAIDFVNKYHARVHETLAPLLNQEERAFLRSKTKEIAKKAQISFPKPSFLLPLRRTLDRYTMDFRTKAQPHINSMKEHSAPFWAKVKSITRIADDTDIKLTAENIRSNIDFRGTSVWVLIFSIAIACLGLNVNSTAVIIGAMLISPLMGPIMGVGLSLSVNDEPLLRRSLKNLAIMVAISLVVSTLYFILSPLGEAKSELLARTRPGIYDVLIALFGGAAGIFALLRKERSGMGNAVAGVAIATALMPPLCTAGFAIATFSPAYFIGACYLFFVNAFFIALATLIITRYLGFPKVKFLDKAKERKAKRYIWVITALVIIPCIVVAVNVWREAKAAAEAKPAVGSEQVPVDKAGTEEQEIEN